jgi:hypothetical protein
MLKSFRNKILIRKTSEAVQSTCNYCGFLARDNDDLSSISRIKACTECFSLFYNEINKNIRLTKEVVRDRMNIFIEEV